MVDIKFQFNTIEFNVRGTIVLTKLSNFKNSGAIKDYLNKKEKEILCKRKDVLIGELEQLLALV